MGHTGRHYQRSYGARIKIRIQPLSLTRFLCLRCCCDALGIGASYVLAYIIKFKVPHITEYFWEFHWGVIQQHAQIEPYLASLWLVLAMAFLFLIVVGAYRPSFGIMPSIDEFIKLLKAMLMLNLTLGFIQFFNPIIPGSRMVVFYFLLCSVPLLLMMRMLIFRWESACFKKGIGLKKSIIIGTSDLSQDVAERMVMYPRMGYAYMGSLDDAPPDTIHFHLKHRFKLLGAPEHVMAVCNDHNIDAIFLFKTDIPKTKYRELVQFALAKNIQLNMLSEPMLDTPFARATVFDGIPIMSTVATAPSGFSRISKRAIDIGVSMVGLICCAPLFGAIACWIKTVSPNGPVFFRQERVGQFGRSFQMIKFRSMVPDAEAKTGPIMVNESGDSRYIRGGQWLRQFSFDELPQLWNVFKGDMSLVGPRPERPHFVQQFSRRVPFFNARHEVPVGITGWAQINGRSVLTRRPDQKLKYDIYYINHWSLLLDIKILIKTCAVVWSREESY